MRKVSTREMRSALPHLEDVLAREGELVITRRGAPVARVVAIEGTGPRPSHARLRARMTPSTIGSDAYIRQDRDDR